MQIFCDTRGHLFNFGACPWPTHLFGCAHSTHSLSVLFFFIPTSSIDAQGLPGTRLPHYPGCVRHCNHYRILLTVCDFLSNSTFIRLSLLSVRCGARTIVHIPCKAICSQTACWWNGILVLPLSLRRRPCSKKTSQNKIVLKLWPRDCARGSQFQHIWAGARRSFAWIAGMSATVQKAMAVVLKYGCPRLSHPLSSYPLHLHATARLAWTPYHSVSSLVKLKRNNRPFYFAGSFIGNNRPFNFSVSFIKCNRPFYFSIIWGTLFFSFIY